MFICGKCCEKRQFDPWSFSSYGPCEFCNKNGVCADVPCDAIPPLKKDNLRSLKERHKKTGDLQ